MTTAVVATTYGGPESLSVTDVEVPSPQAGEVTIEVRAAGINPPPSIDGDWSPASGYAAGSRLARNPEVTAVFVANDDMAIGVMRAFAEAGREVPDDVSVVGLDDIPSAAYQTPPLTTIRQDFGAMARQGLEHLVSQIEASTDETPRVTEPPVCLVVRRSTARPRSRG